MSKLYCAPKNSGTPYVFLFFLQIPALPLDWYNQFVIEVKYGFNKSTKKLWVADKIKGVIIGFIGSILLISVILTIMFYFS